MFGKEEKTKAPAKAASSSVKPDLKHLKPYGDHMGDGALQLSFTLPVPLSPEAKEAAKLYAEKMGLERVIVASAERIGAHFTFFVVYGHSTTEIDFSRVKVPTPEFQRLDHEEVERIVREKIGRKIVVVGATTGSDAHTVGIDAILNRKGYAGDYGLESYDCFQVINLRAQVENQDLLRKAADLNADAVLVSKLVTQQDQHLKDLKDLLKLIKHEKGLPSHLLKIAGGPRMTHEIAVKLGFDAGFGAGTLPSEVASFIVQSLAKRIKK
ncbi:MAG: OAM dimerization domain-containing protein [bacterium]